MLWPSQQMTNQLMSGHPFSRVIFCQKGTERANNFWTKQHLFDSFDDKELHLKGKKYVLMANLKSEPAS